MNDPESPADSAIPDTSTPAAAATEAPLMAQLAALGIAVAIYRHPPLHTVAESQAQRGQMPGGHIKNLFVRDKKRRYWLVTVPEDAEIDLKALRHILGATGNLSFGAADALVELLGVRPGAVTPFAVLNDTDGVVGFALERSLLDTDPINAHPLHNEATIAVAPADLLRFVAACGHEPLLFGLDEIAAIAARRRDDHGGGT
jgi:Ala-tRNA(Pro) deacylase